MGFFDIFKKKSEKLTKEQLDEIEEKVGESEKKHLKEELILSSLSKPSKAETEKKPVKPLKRKARKTAAKKSVKKKAKKQARKAKKSSKKKGRKRR